MDMYALVMLQKSRYQCLFLFELIFFASVIFLVGFMHDWQPVTLAIAACAYMSKDLVRLINISRMWGHGQAAKFIKIVLLDGLIISVVWCLGVVAQFTLCPQRYKESQIFLSFF